MIVERLRCSARSRATAGTSRRGWPNATRRASTCRCSRRCRSCSATGRSPSAALDLSRRLNDHIAGVVAAHPARFVGLGTIPMQSPDLAIRELERCVRELGLSGRPDRLERQRGEPRQPGALSDLRGGRVARRRRLRPPVGDGRPGSDDALLAPLARRDARGDFARDLLAHLRRRAREAAGPADRLRARRRRLSGDDRANRPRLRRAARPVRRLQRRLPARIPAADLRRLARARSADAALPRRPDGPRSDRPRQRLSLPARRGSPGRADRFVRIPGGDPRAAAARHGARVARPFRRSASLATR